MEEQQQLPITDQEILDLSLKIEREGEGFYKSLAELIPEADVRQFLDHMAAEEVRHVHQFKKLLQVKDGKDYGWEDKKELKDLLQGLFETDIFPSLDSTDKTNVPFDTIQKAIEFAIEAEMVSIEFYRMLGEYCNNLEAKTALLILEKAEGEHLTYVKTLQERYNTSR